MIPSADAIVNSLLVREGADDPEQYVDWLKQKASIGELTDIRFGAAISTSGSDVIELNAREAGVDLTQQATRDQLERDLALIEANGLAILRRIGLHVSDEGHDANGDRICTAWLNIHPQYDADIAHEIVLDVLRHPSEEAASTSRGTMNSLDKVADRLIYENVSELGQRLIDVDIFFFDLDRLKAWAKFAHLEESAKIKEAELPPEDEPSTVYTHDTLIPDQILRELGYRFGRDNYWSKQIAHLLFMVWLKLDKFEFDIQVYQQEPRGPAWARGANWTLRGSLAGVPIRKLKDKLTTWEQRALAGALTDRSIGIGDLVNETVDPDAPEGYLEKTFSLDTLLRQKGYYFEGGEWFKEFNLPNRRPIMITVKRRGHATGDDADTLYDLTVYSAYGKEWSPFGYAYSKTLLSLRDAIQRMEDWLAGGGAGPIPEALEQSSDPDNPEHFVKNIVTDWRVILRQHSFTDVRGHEGYMFNRKFPDKVWKKPAELFAQHRWHPDPPVEDPEAMARRYKGRDMALPDLVVFDVLRGTSEVQIPTQRLDHFLTVLEPLLQKAVADQSHQNCLTNLLGAALKQASTGLAYEAPPEPEMPAEDDEFLDEAVPQPPPEDDPEAVLKVHQQGLFQPELKRLGFTVGKNSSTVKLFGEDLPTYWVKSYQAADGTQRGVYIFLIHVLSGGNEYRVNNFDAANKCWYKHDMASEINVHCQTTVQAAAALRDLDAAMTRSAEMSLPLDQEHEMLQRVASHHSQWYWSVFNDAFARNIDLRAPNQG